MDGRLISKKSFDSYKPEPFIAGPCGRTEARVVEGSGPLAGLLRKERSGLT